MESCEEDVSQQPECRKHTGNIQEDYRSLTLLLHDFFAHANQPQPWGVAWQHKVPTIHDPRTGTRASSWNWSNPDSKILSLARFMKLKREPPGVRNSRQIDTLISEEQLRPWTRSDMFMAPVEPHLRWYLQSCLAATNYTDKQHIKDELRCMVMKCIQNKLDNMSRWSPRKSPEEAVSKAREWKGRLVATDDSLTDDELDLLKNLCLDEYVLGAECNPYETMHMREASV